MRRWVPVVLAMVILFGMAAHGAQTLTVRPPNDTGYGPTALSILQSGLAKLQKILGDYSLGCDRYFTADEWQSRDFAAYTAGTLERLGYETRLVEQTGWPDGSHVWVLVGIALAGDTGWIPVEACPAIGKRQQILGTVPTTTDSAGTLWFDPRYTSFDGEVSLPHNQPPVAQIRAVPGTAVVGQNATFLGVTSYDPDGEIVGYQWDLGGVETSQQRTTTVAFPAAGTYHVVLTVTGSRGATATTHLDFIVREVIKTSAPPASSGCGCGG